MTVPNQLARSSLTGQLFLALCFPTLFFVSRPTLNPVVLKSPWGTWQSGGARGGGGMGGAMTVSKEAGGENCVRRKRYPCGLGRENKGGGREVTISMHII